MTTRIVLGMPWFARETYAAVLDTMEDAASLPRTFDEWHQLAEAAYAKATAEGVMVIRANVDPTVFKSWCAERGFRTGHDCRMAFAHEVAMALYQEGRA